MIVDENTVIDRTVEYATFENYEDGKYIPQILWYDRDYIYRRLVHEMKRKYLYECKGIMVKRTNNYDGFETITFVEADDFGKSRLTFHIKQG